VKEDWMVKQYVGSLAEATAQEQRDRAWNLINRPPHYTSGSIECWDYVVSQRLGFLEGNVVKYVTRYRHKNGLEDLKKARQYLEKLISEQEKQNGDLQPL
jgi:predicted dinucleotide-utilizing enzyme